MKNKQGDKQTLGFTLSELLVVIAIIGVLSAIVLASLSASRTKSADASVMSSLNQARLQSTSYYVDNNNYGVVMATAKCPTSGTSMFYADTKIRSYIQEANVANGNNTYCAAGSVSGSGANTWVIASPLKGSSGYWCVDGQGASKKVGIIEKNDWKDLFFKTAFATAGPPPGPNFGGGDGSPAGCN